MFKRSVFLSMLIGCSLTVFSQEEEENTFILICNGNRPAFTLDELRNCSVSIRENDYAVRSFKVALVKKGKGDEWLMEGETFSEEVLEKIGKQKGPRIIRVSGLVDANDTEVEGFRELTITD